MGVAYWMRMLFAIERACATFIAAQWSAARGRKCVDHGMKVSNRSRVAWSAYLLAVAITLLTTLAVSATRSGYFISNGLAVSRLIATYRTSHMIPHFSLYSHRSTNTRPITAIFTILIIHPSISRCPPLQRCICCHIGRLGHASF